MKRVSLKELDLLAGRLNDIFEITNEREQFVIGHAYGSPRLEKNRGSIDVSPRLPSGQLRDWIYAYIGGIYAERDNNRQ